MLSDNTTTYKQLLAYLLAVVKCFSVMLIVCESSGADQELTDVRIKEVVA